jgi:AcrR family transcriptional regulator
MSPRSLQFTKEEVGNAALELVREQGWEALSARSLASRLGVSVAPVYGAFASMEELQAFVLAKAIRILDDTISSAGSGRTFLDMGIGLALFARDEPELNLALLGNGKGGFLDRYKAELRSRLDGETFLSQFGKSAVDRMFERLWIFTLGLMGALAFGYQEDRSDSGLAALMRSAGALVIYGVAADIDREGPASLEAWRRLASEKNLDLGS